MNHHVLYLRERGGTSALGGVGLRHGAAELAARHTELFHSLDSVSLSHMHRCMTWRGGRALQRSAGKDGGDTRTCAGTKRPLC